MWFELRSVVHHYWLQEKGPSEIHNILKETYKADCPSKSFVKTWVTNFENGRTQIENLPRSGRPRVHQYIELVKRCIEEFPFSSTRSIAAQLNIDKNTVINILVNDLHREKRNARWIPHDLSPIQISERLSDSRTLLNMLNKFSSTQFMNVVTCDESFLYLNYFHEQAYLLEGESVEIPKRMISDQKILIFTAFSGHGLHLLEVFPPKTRISSALMCNIILPKLDENIRKDLKLRKNQFINIHFDNAPSHNSIATKSKMNELRMNRLPHPAYSPDVSPNDFFLYGFVKNQLKGMMHSTVEELKSSLSKIIEKIDESTWKSVMKEWKERLNRVIDADGSYQ